MSKTKTLPWKEVDDLKTVWLEEEKRWQETFYADKNDAKLEGYLIGCEAGMGKMVTMLIAIGVIDEPISG